MTEQEAIEQLTIQKQLYAKSIEALDMAINQLEKEIPKKVAVWFDRVKGIDYYACPTCESFFRYIYYEEEYFCYCKECGQRLDWD